MSTGILVKAVQETSGVQCPICNNSDLHRMRRVGFLQRRVFSLFGYYPWECGACRKTHYFKQRNQKRRTSPSD
jgi:hypothetical protein